MALQKVLMMECDNPKCDARYEHTKADPAPGYHFPKGGFLVHGGGQPIPPVYAHASQCIEAAVEAVVMIDDGYDWNGLEWERVR